MRYLHHINRYMSLIICRVLLFDFLFFFSIIPKVFPPSGLDYIPKRFKALEKGLEAVKSEVEKAARGTDERLLGLEGYLDGSKGRKVSTDEYGDVINVLERLEDDTSKKFCEFGGLVETLQVNTNDLNFVYTYILAHFYFDNI